MLQTELIADPAQGPGGTPEVAEFLGTFQVYRAHDDVIMDMVLIYVRADDKSVVSLRQPHGKPRHPHPGLCRFGGYTAAWLK